MNYDDLEVGKSYSCKMTPYINPKEPIVVDINVIKKEDNYVEVQVVGSDYSLIMRRRDFDKWEILEEINKV